jgi:hypothetical protein
LGLVEISTGNTHADFSLLNPDGSLNLAPRTENGVLAWQPRIFEIRLMPRFTFWRYYLSGALPGGTAPLGFRYEAPQNRLVATEARRLTRVRTPVQLNTSTRLPSPDKPDLTREQNHYFSEIFLSTL